MRGQLDLNHANASSSCRKQAETVGVVVVGDSTANTSEKNRFCRRRSCKFSIMAKVLSCGILIAISIIILLGILSQFGSNARKVRGRGSLRRRKFHRSRTTTTSTTSAPALETTTMIIGSELSPEEYSKDFSVRSGSGHFPLSKSKGRKVSGSGNQCLPVCERENCPIPPDCPLGLVLDHCSCCRICAVGEGSRCYKPGNPAAVPRTPSEGICGSGLICVDRIDLGPGEPPEALCECRNSIKVCGSDNVTYSSECKLREAAHLKPDLILASWNPCASAPWITTGMESVTGAIGQDVSLSCEFRSFPASVIHWEFSPEGSSERHILPGDSSSIIQSNRGGPEELMTTSWIQIISVTRKRQGTYFCIAKNTEGMGQSYAYLSVHSHGNP